MSSSKLEQAPGLQPAEADEVEDQVVGVEGDDVEASVVLLVGDFDGECHEDEECDAD